MKGLFELDFQSFHHEGNQGSYPNRSWSRNQRVILLWLAFFDSPGPLLTNWTLLHQLAINVSHILSGEDPLRFPESHWDSIKELCAVLSWHLKLTRRELDPIFVENGKWASHNPICEAWWKDDSQQPSGCSNQCESG